MKYNVPIKTKAQLGDLITFHYRGGSDIQPIVLFLASMQTPENHKLITGFNLNYINGYKNQKAILFRARELAVKYKAKAVYEKLLQEFPKLRRAYRQYTVSHISGAKKFDFDQIKLVPA